MITADHARAGTTKSKLFADLSFVYQYPRKVPVSVGSELVLVGGSFRWGAYFGSRAYFGREVPGYISR